MLAAEDIFYLPEVIDGKKALKLMLGETLLKPGIHRIAGIVVVDKADNPEREH